MRHPAPCNNQLENNGIRDALPRRINDGKTRRELWATILLVGLA